MSDYTDETYERYMLTGEGAEYFEDEYDEEDVEIVEDEEELSGFDRLERQLDKAIYYLEQKLKEQKRLAKAQNNSTAKKK